LVVPGWPQMRTGTLALMAAAIARIMGVDWRLVVFVMLRSWVVPARRPDHVRSVTAGPRSQLVNNGEL
jgi:hypothetical protein